MAMVAVTPDGLGKATKREGACYRGTEYES